MDVRDLSLPLIGAEDTPLTPSGGGTSAVVGGDETVLSPSKATWGMGRRAVPDLLKNSQRELWAYQTLVVREARRCGGRAYDLQQATLANQNQRGSQRGGQTDHALCPRPSFHG